MSTKPLCDNPPPFGVIYTPLPIPKGNPTSSSHFSILLKSNVKFVRLQWLDYINTLRFRLIPLPYFRRLLESERPGTGVVKCTLGLVFLALAPGFGSSGEYLLVPDLSSLRICPYAPGHASVMAYLQEKVPSPDHGLTVPICPRTILEKVIQEAAQNAGVSFLVGFETEFILLKETSPRPVEVNRADWATSRKIPTGHVETTILEEIADALQDADIEVQLIHAEAAPGQYEVVTGPMLPMDAADALVFTRETIYNIASKHGIRATLAPRIHPHSAGSAAHVHISVHPLNDNKSGDRLDQLAPTLSPHSRSFLQSLLAHLPSICAFTLPTQFSYGRMLDGIWSGGTWVGWGIESRESPIRITGPNAPATRSSGNGGGQHFEVRCIDGTSSPYLALAAILGVGAKGVAENATLSVRGVEGGEGAKTIAEMTEKERLETGVGSSRLPLTLAEARKRLCDDQRIRDLLGSDFVDKYLSVNETMEELFPTETEEATITKLVEYW